MVDKTADVTSFGWQGWAVCAELKSRGRACRYERELGCSEFLYVRPRCNARASVRGFVHQQQRLATQFIQGTLILMEWRKLVPLITPSWVDYVAALVALDRIVIIATGIQVMNYTPLAVSAAVKTIVFFRV